MKKYFSLLLVMPFFAIAQIDTTIKLKVAMMQNFVHKDSLGETAFWQTKGKITFGIVKYTDLQNPIFKDLFIKQYQELLPIYKKMVVSEDERDTALFVKILIRQEDDFRNLLSQDQLKLYLNQLKEWEIAKKEILNSYSSLFFSENLLKEYKYRFSYKP